MDQPPLNEAKRDLRRTVRERLGSFCGSDRAMAASVIARRVAGLDVFGRAGAVMAYWALGDEVDLRSAISAGLEAGKTVCLPRMIDGERGLEAVAIEGVAFEGAAARFGVVEPRAGRVVGMDEIGLVIAPGVAFDRLGGRLGRGKGYYDRFLAGRPATVTVVGVCFEAQVVEAVPRGAGDERVDRLVTEAGVREC
jgi:5-formyltetrahydrofolate cyclo-ligase